MTGKDGGERSKERKGRERRTEQWIGTNEEKIHKKKKVNGGKTKRGHL